MEISVSVVEAHKALSLLARAINFTDQQVNFINRTADALLSKTHEPNDSQHNYQDKSVTDIYCIVIGVIVVAVAAFQESRDALKEKNPRLNRFISPFLFEQYEKRSTLETLLNDTADLYTSPYYPETYDNVLKSIGFDSKGKSSKLEALDAQQQQDIVWRVGQHVMKGSLPCAAYTFYEIVRYNAFRTYLLIHLESFDDPSKLTPNEQQEANLSKSLGCFSGMMNKIKLSSQKGSKSYAPCGPVECAIEITYTFESAKNRIRERIAEHLTPEINEHFTNLMQAIETLKRQLLENFEKETDSYDYDYCMQIASAVKEIAEEIQCNRLTLEDIDAFMKKTQQNQDSQITHVVMIILFELILITIGASLGALLGLAGGPVGVGIGAVVGAGIAGSAGIYLSYPFWSQDKHEALDIITQEATIIAHM